MADTNSAVGVRCLALQVHHLAANHASHGAGGAAKFLLEWQPLPAAGQTQSRQRLIRLGLQRISAQNRNRFAEHNMAGRLSPAQIVVVERRQIVMHPESRCAAFPAPPPGLQCPLEGLPWAEKIRADSMHSIGRSRLPPAKRAIDASPGGWEEGSVSAGGSKTFQRAIRQLPHRECNIVATSGGMVSILPKVRSESSPRHPRAGNMGHRPAMEPASTCALQPQPQRRR